MRLTLAEIAFLAAAYLFASQDERALQAICVVMSFIVAFWLMMEAGAKLVDMGGDDDEDGPKAR